MTYEFLKANGTTLSVSNPEPNIVFLYQSDSSKELLKLCQNGEIYVKGNLIKSDIEVVDALREFLKHQGFLK